MSVFVVYPKNSHSAYEIAADVFVDLAKRVGQTETKKMTDEEYLALNTKPEKTVLIGHDGANSALAELLLLGKTSKLGFRYGTDDYTIRTEKIADESIVILAGGRPRSSIYAVYRYFEKFCGCRWFWDGDRVPSSNLPFDGLSLNESPHFDYRGTRYFAHRSLHRFQAEHWGFDDWKNEIDWILKSRLNLFMLRIGTDDLYQKAFPDTVPYPDRDSPLPESSNGYDDRNLFWSLQYRGELRKKILQYAFARDLMHPEDCGTMTHWYSRTPIAFLEKKKPSLLSQSTSNYSEQTGLVFDIRKKKNMEYYEHLTDTHVKEYGRGEIFHTIGLAERMYSEDREENLRMKLFTYRRISANIKEKYPNAKLLLASWDIWMKYTPAEVSALLGELDPEQVIFFDYTSDVQCEHNFTKWDVVGKFPWIFGIFGGMKKQDDIRGDFSLINERLIIAKNDVMCRGMVLWPEFSHGNPLNLYYLTRNAWENDTPSIDSFLSEFCTARYEKNTAEDMLSIWKSMMPVSKLMPWTSLDSPYEYIEGCATFDPKNLAENEEKFEQFMKAKDCATKVLAMIQSVPLDDALTRRDAYDITRTVVGRSINAAILKAEICFVKGDIKGQEKASQIAIDLLYELAMLLGGHEDYSLLHSLEKIRSVTDTNPNFEKTLKNNAECEYNRSGIYENALYLYLPETKIWLHAALDAARKNKSIDVNFALGEIKKNRSIYFETSLADMKRESAPLAKVASTSRALIEELDK